MPRSFIKKEKYYWWKLLLDGFLLLSSFLLVYYVRRGHLIIENKFKRYLPFLFITWLLVTVLSKKFKQYQYVNLYAKLRPFVFSALMITAIVSLEMYVLGWYFLSRFIVYFTFGVFLIFEILYISAQTVVRRKKGERIDVPFSMVFFLFELLFISATFFGIYFYRKRTFIIREEYQILLIGICFSWILVSLIIHKYEIKHEKGFFQALVPYWTSEIVIISLITFFILFTNLAFFSRFIVLSSLIGLSLLENLVVIIYFLLKKEKSGEDRMTLMKARVIEYEPESLREEIPLPPKKKYEFQAAETKSDLFKKKLKNIYLKQLHKIFQFIDRNVKLTTLDIAESVVLHTHELSHTRNLEDNSLTFFLNLSKSNHFRHLNKTFIEINKKLKPGGVFVGRFESLSQSKSRLYDTYPFVLATIFYPFYFVFKRVIPKMPFFRKIYFALTKGKNRVISNAEVMGRLYFCGFNLIDMNEIDESIWFIVRKEREPLKEENPSYGPLFKQKRVGREGRIICVYKFRTMHPYSEFIQEYLFDLHHLDDIGKIKDDFRVTTWGKVLRRLWIDEFPSLFNVVRGDMKIFGVRPLSQDFFKTYPEDLKKRRVKYKPGIIPPYYVDMPNTIEDVWESERKYLDKYSYRPFRTDVSYFFMALKNIFFHHVKSG